MYSTRSGAARAVGIDTRSGAARVLKLALLWRAAAAAQARRRRGAGAAQAEVRGTLSWRAYLCSRRIDRTRLGAQCVAAREKVMGRSGCAAQTQRATRRTTRDASRHAKRGNAARGAESERNNLECYCCKRASPPASPPTRRRCGELRQLRMTRDLDSFQRNREFIGQLLADEHTQVRRLNRNHAGHEVRPRRKVRDSPAPLIRFSNDAAAHTIHPSGCQPAQLNERAHADRGVHRFPRAANTLWRHKRRHLNSLLLSDNYPVIISRRRHCCEENGADAREGVN